MLLFIEKKTKKYITRIQRENVLKLDNYIASKRTTC